MAVSAGSGATLAPLDFRKIWDGAMSFEDFLTRTRPEHQALWRGIYRNAKAPDWAAEMVDGRRLHLLAITEDWCLDTSNTLPFIARVVEAVPGLDLRLILRDSNAPIMDHFLTDGSRSIPVVIVLDEEFRLVGHWGPRPSELQAWVMANRPVLPRPEVVKEERRWYARDRGETTVREVLEVATRTSTPS